MVQPLVKAALWAGGFALAAMGWSEHRRHVAVHKALTKFHERIKHEEFGERELLRERRQALESALKGVLPDGLQARTFVQGSYATRTGVKPLTGEFDIDVGLVLDRAPAFFGGDPVAAKLMVREALRKGSRRVRVRNSCVTVDYSQEPYGPFHVDIAVYTTAADGRLMLSKGREHSRPKYRFWDPSEPEKLSAALNGRFSGGAIAQFRRCVRYLKRWKHVQLEAAAPHSIALTTAAYHWFRPELGSFLIEEPDDGAALLALIERILAAASEKRLEIRLPLDGELARDLLGDMTPKQMEALLAKLS
jgi:hypothetical protein